jgi:hypothetical protein
MIGSAAFWRSVRPPLHATDGVDRLVDFDGEDNTTKVTRFANYLCNMFPSSDAHVMQLAAKALGRR